MEQDSSLYTDAFARNIVLVSPTTLLVTLRTIQNIWRYEYQNRNALDIADRAGKICDQVSLIGESMDDLGDKIGKAQVAWGHHLQTPQQRPRQPLPPGPATERSGCKSAQGVTGTWR